MPRPRERKFHEQDIKAALLEWHRQNGELKDAVVICEMVVADWRHRIDLVVVTDEVKAYEIKSDFDNLKRLRGQMRAFVPRFDNLTIVCAPKFTQKVLEEVPSGVGVMQYVADDETITFEIIRDPSEVPIADKTKFISILNKAQLAKFLRSRGKKFSGNKSKSTLAEMAIELPWEDLRSAVAKVLRVRYAKTSNSFLSCLQKDKPISPQDLEHLVKWKTFRRTKNWKNPDIEF